MSVVGSAVALVLGGRRPPAVVAAASASRSTSAAAVGSPSDCDGLQHVGGLSGSSAGPRPSSKSSVAGRRARRCRAPRVDDDRAASRGRRGSAGRRRSGRTASRRPARSCAGSSGSPTRPLRARRRRQGRSVTRTSVTGSHRPVAGSRSASASARVGSRVRRDRRPPEQHQVGSRRAARLAGRDGVGDRSCPGAATTTSRSSSPVTRGPRGPLPSAVDPQVERSAGRAAHRPRRGTAPRSAAPSGAGRGPSSARLAAARPAARAGRRSAS